MTLTAGVYSFSSSAQLTGTLTLDAEGDPDAVFIFQIGNSATLGTNTSFVGHIFALTSIAAQTGTTVQGQLLARNGAVTLDNNTITNGVCEAVPTESETATDTETATTTTKKHPANR
jgi:hypothetical protein